MADTAASILKMKTMDHISMVVKDARRTAEQWESMLGIGPWAFHARGGTKPDGEVVKAIVAYAYAENGVEYELIEIVEGTVFHSEFIDKHGEGLHHIGFAVEDFEADTEKLVAAGAEVVLRQSGCTYVRFDGDGGVITELYRKHPPYTTDML
jgi:methylmalonyl-CoA/ethylmalonyl-CoA epimerase